ncbi:predicted protein [Botrytis cinerea T4]|uniref:Uncharacterized protein n=1 Tax=Botryotinia fuckeliana (strain T4) TaxID=999810 RepID=G2Y396_BOTF4|nr:predicted protein [Botrytis cinerea T4]
MPEDWWGLAYVEPPSPISHIIKVINPFKIFFQPIFS